MKCSRCEAEIEPGEQEACWVCMGPLCEACWDEFGECGHTDDEKQARLESLTIITITEEPK